MPVMPELLREQEAFDAKLDERLKEHAGEWLVQLGEGERYFTSHAEAYAWALEQYGPRSGFLLARIERRRAVTIFTTA